MSSHVNTFPKLHNAAWPGVVGKGEGSEPAIDLDTMLDFTAGAEVDGVKFDGFDLFLFLPHINIDATDDELKELADKASSRGSALAALVKPSSKKDLKILHFSSPATFLCKNRETQNPAALPHPPVR